MSDLLVKIAKATAIIAISAGFLVAINALIGAITTFVSGTFVGEAYALVSMYMPFNATVVFSALLSACSAIFAFMSAKKIFDLTSWGINSI